MAIDMRRTKEALERVIEPTIHDQLPEPLSPYEEFSAQLDARLAALNVDAKRKGRKPHPEYGNFVRQILADSNGAHPNELAITRPIR
jgi:hypothetical protein